MRTIHPIEARSLEILRSRVDLSELPPLRRAVTERVIHARINAPMVADAELYLELFDAMIDSISFRRPLAQPAGR